MPEKNNKMREPLIEKVTLNIGVGQAGDALENAKTLLEKLSGSKAVPTSAKNRNPTFKIRKGDLIGAKTTLRGAQAGDFLKKAFEAANNRISLRSIDTCGNFSFGIPEYIEFPGAKYDPVIGMLGFEVSVTMKRKGGFRVAKRRRNRSKISKSHRLTQEEVVQFLQEKFNVKAE